MSTVAKSLQKKVAGTTNLTLEQEHENLEDSMKKVHIERPGDQQIR